MSIIGSNLLAGASGQAADSGYEIERSLRFYDDDSASLNRTFGTSTNNQKSTVSFWMKRSNLDSYMMIWQGGVDSGSAGNYSNIRFNPDNRIEILDYQSGYACRLITNAVFRDISAWYHIVLAIDTTQGTPANRNKFYVNGEQVTSFSTQTNYGSGDNPMFNKSSTNHYIGRYQGSSALYYFAGYIAEFNFVDGQQLDVTDFGETDTETGAWIPKKYTGSYGNNGFYLNFSDNSSAAALGTDSSPNGNTWTPTNFSVTPGVGNDSVTDSPTNNYPTLNRLDMTGGDMFQGNLTYAGPYSSVVSRNGHGARSTLKVPSSGKWYLECANITYSGLGNSCYLALTSSEQLISSTSGFYGNLTPFIGVDASVFNNKIYLRWAGVSGGTTSGTILFTSYASGDIVNFAIDFDDGKFWVGKNGTWYNSGNPAAGTNATCTFTAGTKPWGFWAEYVSSSDNSNRSQPRVNFGQQGFEYTAPSGFLAMSTANLPVPTIKDGTDYFNTVLYTGNGGTNPITTVGFQPDLVWMKSRSSGTDNHYLANSVSGVQKALFSNLTIAEATDSNGLTAFTSTGFTIGSQPQINTSSVSHVAWNWLAGGSSSSNTDGSITSTVSANVDAGFSIVSYTGNGTAGATIGHGLGVAPSMVIVKNRDAVTDWSVWSKPITDSLGAAYVIFLQASSSAGAYSGVFNSTAPTSSVFSVGTSSSTNTNTNDYIAYCFAEVEGYSKFGSYEGISSATGPYIYCGFRPAFLIVKNITDNSTSWVIHDAKRDSDNGLVEYLLTDSSAAEATLGTSVFNFTANGFFARDNYGSNWSFGGKKYIFMAFAETPFKYANAR